MKIVSLNLRGIDSIAKQKRVKKLVQKEKFDVCLFQETKRSEVDALTVARMWGGDDFEWVAQSSNGLSGGILSVWRKGLFTHLFFF